MQIKTEEAMKLSKKQIILIFIISLILLILIDLAMFRLEYQGYQESMEILHVMLTVDLQEGADSEEEKTADLRLSLAASLLKGDIQEELDETRQLLSDYGYAAPYTDYYLKKMYSRCLVIGGMTAILFIFFWAAFILISYTYGKNRKREEEEVRDYITAIRDGKFDISFPGEHITPAADTINSRLKMDLESLASYVKVMKYESETEKEETKSLVTDISHQLKTPVAALNTSFEILGDQQLTLKEREEFSQRCREQILRLKELIEALVNISRMETGMIVVNRPMVRIFYTILLAVNRIYPKAEEKQIEITLEAEEDIQQLKIPHDTKWLSEAVINILDNSIKYSPQRTDITIRIIKMTSLLRIEVEDEGIGVSKKERNMIFKRFYRGESREVKEQSGSGVGLYLVRKILEMHQGTVAVSSPRGSGKRGSLFIIQLPYTI